MLIFREEDGMGRRGYPSEFRRRVLDLVVSGRKVHEVARDLGISDQTIYVWRRQERVDRGDELGLTSTARAELAAARRRISELETELAVHRRAAELLKESTDPKVVSRPSR
jgi:transposase